MQGLEMEWAKLRQAKEDEGVGYVSINLDHHGRTQSIILMEKKKLKLHT